MTFDIEKFRTIYPQFAEIPDATLEFMWNNALMISGIEDDTRIPEAQKENLLFMLVCHLATLAIRGTAGAMTSAKTATRTTHRKIMPPRIAALFLRSLLKASPQILVP